MISHIYVNGDSYSAVDNEFQVYSQLLGKKVNLPSINDAVVGSSNDRIIRTTLEHVLSLENQKPLVIIGFSFVTREEIWLDNILPYQKRIKDYPRSQFITSSWLKSEDVDDLTKHIIIDQNINKQVIHFYTKLYMLASTLKNLGIPYLFFSAGDNTDFRNLNWDSLDSLKLYKEITQNTDIIDFRTFNIPSWAKQQSLRTSSTGHLLNDGHERFSEFLFEKLKHKFN